MEFLNKDYKEEITAAFGDGAKFDNFIAFLNELSRFDYN